MFKYVLELGFIADVCTRNVDGGPSMFRLLPRWMCTEHGIGVAAAPTAPRGATVAVVGPGAAGIPA